MHKVYIHSVDVKKKKKERRKKKINKGAKSYVN